MLSLQPLIRFNGNQGVRFVFLSLSQFHVCTILFSVIKHWTVLKVFKFSNLLTTLKECQLLKKTPKPLYYDTRSNIFEIHEIWFFFPALVNFFISLLTFLSLSSSLSPCYCVFSHVPPHCPFTLYPLNQFTIQYDLSLSLHVMATWCAHQDTFCPASASIRFSSQTRMCSLFATKNLLLNDNKALIKISTLPTNDSQIDLIVQS